MHSYVLESIGFKLDMIIDATVSYILILVYLTLTLIEVIGVQESKNFYTSFLAKCSMDLNRIVNAVEICWYNQSPVHFIFSIQYSRKRILLI